MTDPERLLAALNPEQRQVTLALAGPVRVLAGAGTGKTRAITHRVAYGVATGHYRPQEVLALSFTTRAAGEMRSRLADLGAPGVQARTFHSAALRQLRYFWPKTYRSDLPHIIESKLSLLGAVAKKLALPTDQAALKDLAAAIEWAKVSNVTPETYPVVGANANGMDAPTIGRAFAGYETLKREAGRMDLEDVLLLTAGMLAEEPQVVAQVRDQYRWFVVDEFQDVSPLQSALLDLWLGDRQEICVVGDPAQTIFSFAGAKPELLLGFAEKFPETQTVELRRNYRSTPQIVEFANGVLRGVMPGALKLQAQGASGDQVAAHSYPDEPAEAEGVARQIQRLIESGTSPQDMAILVRINSLSQAFEDALAVRQIKYAVRGGRRFFDRPEIKEAVTRLRGEHRAGVNRGDAIANVLAAMNWVSTPPPVRGEQRDRWESLDTLRSLIEAQEKDLAELIADLDRRAADQHDPAASGVTITTMHAAKGLEWPVVFVCGLAEGTMPIAYAEGLHEIAEEGRLLYVALTRAQRALHVSWALARTPGGRAVRKGSRFLPQAKVAASAKPERRPRSRKMVNCHKCGAALRTGAEKKLGRCQNCPGSHNERLYLRLCEWRKARADVDRVPAFVVFTDATLMLIAEHEPQDGPSLLAVSGVGPTKLERYGPEVLDVINQGQVPASNAASNTASNTA
jgi:DNA helicase II / ATP-dependent DNA helicase PcrA